MADNIVASRHSSGHGQKKAYVAGYALSIALTIVPFVIVANKLIWGWALVLTLFGFAFVQLFVQLRYFIHLGHEQRPRWNRIVFLFMALVLLIVVIGSLWIMYNLDYNMMHKPSGGQKIPTEGF